MKPKTIIISISVVLFLIILAQNTQVVTFRLFFWKVEMSRILFLLLVAAFGFITGYLTAKTTSTQHK